MVIAVLVLLIGLGMGLTGNLGAITIADEEVALKVNYITGKSDIITEPGIKLFLPYIEEVFPLDRRPQKFLMEGKTYDDDNHVPYLTVRAKDGSNFWFEELEVQYSLIPGEIDHLVEDSGPGDGFKRRWIRAHARSILRDEFGRYSSEEVANPSTYAEARNRSKQRLDERLNPHGLQIVFLPNPKPKFDEAYERAIEDRKVADQDVERLISKKDQLLREREQRLAEVEKEKEVEWSELQGDLTRDILNAERDAIRVTRSADAYALERVAGGQAEKAQRTAQATGLVDKYTKEAEGVLAQAKALEERGAVVVREALIEKLATIRFTLVPYSKDSAPKRLEHVGDASSAREASAARED